MMQKYRDKLDPNQKKIYERIIEDPYYSFNCFSNKEKESKYFLQNAVTAILTRQSELNNYNGKLLKILNEFNEIKPYETEEEMINEYNKNHSSSSDNIIKKPYNMQDVSAFRVEFINNAEIKNLIYAVNIMPEKLKKDSYIIKYIIKRAESESKQINLKIIVMQDLIAEIRVQLKEIYLEEKIMKVKSTLELKELHEEQVREGENRMLFIDKQK